MKAKWKITKHHRKPKCDGGSNLKGNISRVPMNKHEAYHLLFNEGNPHYIAKVLTETWIDTEYVMIAVRKSDINIKPPD